MKNSQRKVLVAGVIAAAIVGLFPPWVHTWSFQKSYSERPAGFHFILDPPAAQGGLVNGVSLDMRRLCVEWAIIALATTCAFVLMSWKRSLPKSANQLSAGDRVTSITCGNCGSPLTVTDANNGEIFLSCPRCPHIKVVRHYLPAPTQPAVSSAPSPQRIVSGIKREGAAFCETCVLETTSESTDNLTRFNGMGTTLREVHGFPPCSQCGSCVAETWVTFFWIPFYSTGKYRILYVSEPGFLTGDAKFYSRKLRTGIGLCPTPREKVW